MNTDKEVPDGVDFVYIRGLTDPWQPLKKELPGGLCDHDTAVAVSGIEDEPNWLLLCEDFFNGYLQSKLPAKQEFDPEGKPADETAERDNKLINYRYAAGALVHEGLHQLDHRCQCLIVSAFI